MRVVGKNRRGAKRGGEVTTIFKAAIVAAVCASSVSAAAQPKWQSIGTSAAGPGEYVDTTTAVRSGDVVIYWSKSEHRNDRGQVLAIYTRQAVDCRNFALAVLDSYSSLDGKPSTGRTFKDANMEDMFFLRSSPANYPSTVGARMICDGVKEKLPL
ncbi:hypothetical protein [Burkholderia gladioli]|uniref:hypothetical protein n=1 Tax=Burkholderia gladioli TaxID=28095 RepID=UPI00163F263D|nr:hypothetical protein [Burkholderia gladioli]MDN7754759.1 hypothetical protein [Burkholderia gladioli]